MKKLIFILAFLFINMFLTAQPSISPVVLNSVGGSVQLSGGGYLAWSVGEPVITPISSVNTIISQGFLQTWPASSSFKNLLLTLYLEGLFNGSNMNKAKNVAGDQFSGLTADQITVELHNSVSPFALAGGPYTVNLETDGSAVFPSIPSSLGSNYYIVVKHRNSVETWNASPISFSGASINYNFSSAATQAYGSNMKLVSGKYMIYSGDVNQDGVIDSGDLIPVDNDAASFFSGYLVTDVNGDGLVNTADITVINNNSTIFIGKITP